MFSPPNKTIYCFYYSIYFLCYPMRKILHGASGFTKKPDGFLIGLPFAVLLWVGPLTARSSFKSTFLGALLWGSCRLCRLRERIPTLRCIFLCCRFNLYRVLYFSIRPLRWGHFCRLIQKYPKNRFFIRRIWWANFDLRGKIKISPTDAATTVSSANLTF